MIDALTAQLPPSKLPSVDVPGVPPCSPLRRSPSPASPRRSRAVRERRRPSRRGTLPGPNVVPALPLGPLPVPDVVPALLVLSIPLAPPTTSAARPAAETASPPTTAGVVGSAVQGVNPGMVAPVAQGLPAVGVGATMLGH